MRADRQTDREEGGIKGERERVREKKEKTERGERKREERGGGEGGRERAIKEAMCGKALSFSPGPDLS